MAVSILVWILLIVVGVPMLLSAMSLYSYRQRMEDIETFREAELAIIPLEQVGSVPKRRLHKFAESLRSIGFNELLGYTKAALAKRGNFNYCWVFVAPDGLTLGEAEYVRINWFERFSILLLGGRRFVPSLCGITLVSAFEGNRKFVTTDLKQIEESDTGLEGICVVPKGTPLCIVYAKHCTARDQFVSTRSLRLKSFKNQHDFVEFERNYRRYLTLKAEQELEDAWDDGFDPSDLF